MIWRTRQNAICKNRSIPPSSPLFSRPNVPTFESNVRIFGWRRRGWSGRVELGLKRVPCRRIPWYPRSIYRRRYVLNDARRRSYESLMDEWRGERGWVQDSATNTKLDTLCRSECGTTLDNRGGMRDPWLLGSISFVIETRANDVHSGVLLIFEIGLRYESS